MNKPLILAAAMLGLAGFVSSGPAFAETGTQAGANSELNSAGQLVDDAVQTVHRLRADHRYDELLKQSRGVFIMPELVKGAFIVGGQGAQGVLVKHESNGTWSEPAFLTIGSLSLGAQAGAKAGPAAMILMTDKALNDFTQAHKLSLNANAGLTIVNTSTQAQAPIGQADIVIWSGQSGAFAGADVSGAEISQNTAEDHAYYGRAMDAKQILGGAATNPNARKLTTALPA